MNEVSPVGQRITKPTVARCAGGAAAMAELLQWHATADAVPDADTTVLMWVVDGAESDWAAGWWDGADWRDVSSGGVVAGVVTHWAEPEGPAC